MPFFLLKGLSFLPFGGILKNPKILFALILVVVLAVVYFKWKGAIEDRIANEIFTEQAQQHIENQKKELERIQKLSVESQRAVREAQERREKLLREVEQARSATRNVDPDRDGEVSPVLRDTLDFIHSRHHAQSPQPPAQRSLTQRAGAALESGTKAVQSAVKATGNAAIDAWKKARGQ